MFERPPLYDAFYLPGPTEGLDTEQALTLGLRWLLAQDGSPLVVLSAKTVLRNNRLLEATVKRHAIPVAAPPRMHQPGWAGGAVLAPWASERALLAIDDELRPVSAVCVIGWSRGDKDTWIAGHGARDLRSPDSEASEPRLDPVVEVAMEHATNSINHNNALVSYAEKAYVVRTLQELHRAGYDLDVETLVAWATTRGWYPDELPRLREYATGVRSGKRFVLRDSWGPGRGAAAEWVAEADRRGG